MTQHFNRRSEKQKRRQLRNNPTDAERVLWQHLKGKQMLGVKFRRQYSVDAYVIDFYAPRFKLAIEVDGPSHFTAEGLEYDAERTQHLEAFGIQILRFNNEDVYKHLDGVLMKIEEAVSGLKDNHPQPPPL